MPVLFFLGNYRAVIVNPVFMGLESLPGESASSFVALTNSFPPLRQVEHHLGNVPQVGLERTGMCAFFQYPVRHGIEVEEPWAHVCEIFERQLLIAPQVLYTSQAVENVPGSRPDLVLQAVYGVCEVADLMRPFDLDDAWVCVGTS
jgi:hypothetical protein